MRIGFTIIFNGLHHLKHNDYAKYLLDNLDYWVVVEGASLSTGSTNWCKTIPEHLHNQGNSVDGTINYLQELKELYPDKLKLVIANGFWKNKDEQVNVAIAEVKKITSECFLWEIDCDEQWTIENMLTSENFLIESGGKTGKFLCNNYFSENLIVKGEWGEGILCPYNRLWLWAGESFQTHEPPILENGNGKEVLIPIKFNHYSYYYDTDVKFKNDWYSGHENIYERWLSIKKLPDTAFPLHISALIVGYWGTTNTYIHKI